jgi:predicted nucleotidyltransferase component of viral defense system
MSDFITLSDAQQKTILTQAAAKTGLPSSAIEKDWWVTQLLRIVFSLPYANSLVFKGAHH